MTKEEIAEYEGIVKGLQEARKYIKEQQECEFNVNCQDLDNLILFYKQKQFDGLKKLQDKKTQEEFSEEQNRLKYGEPENDLIAQKFAISTRYGVLYCIWNIERYAKRFDSNAEKAHNETDLKKMKDYCNRALQVAKARRYYIDTELTNLLKYIDLGSEHILAYCKEIEFALTK